MNDSKAINDLKPVDWVMVPDPTLESRNLEAIANVTLVASQYCKVSVRYFRERKPKIRVYKISDVRPATAYHYGGRKLRAFLEKVSGSFWEAFPKRRIARHGFS